MFPHSYSPGLDICELSFFILFYFFIIIKGRPYGEPNAPGQGERGYLKWTPHVPNLPTAALTTPQKV